MVYSLALLTLLSSDVCVQVSAKSLHAHLEARAVCQVSSSTTFCLRPSVSWQFVISSRLADQRAPGLCPPVLGFCKYEHSSSNPQYPYGYKITFTH